MTDIPQRLAAALADRYRIESELGAGGMATVYLAHDLRHDRKVAVKVLHPDLAAVIGAERFLAEIKTTANLSHPHILPLHDSGAADGFLFYVMPYVEGESLREKLDRDHQLSVDESLGIARKVAGALQYAHEQGVVHRDVKPANILMSRGEPRVADFGIALAVSEAGSGRITETGLSLGTPHYMSPEQATGERGLDARSDVYALGCIVFEMLAGQPPYAGPTAQSVLARILTEQPARLTALRRTVPENVAAAIDRALEKLPADRFASAEEFAKALDDPGFRYAPTAAVAASPARSAEAPERASRAGSPGLFAAVGGLVGLVLGVLAWSAVGPPAPPERVTAVRLGFPDSTTMRVLQTPTMSVAPDGSALVYVGPGESGDQLWYLPFDRVDARPIPGTALAQTPVFSPDGQSVAFVAGSPGDIRIVRLDGTPPVTIVQDSVQAFGISWADDDWIYVTNNTSVLRVRAQGGPLEMVTEPDTEVGETWRGWPHALPGGRYVAFTTWIGDVTSANIGLVDTSTGESVLLGPGVFPRSSPTGHLLFWRSDGTLMAAPLNERAMAFTADPTPIMAGVNFNATQGFAALDLAADGTLVYQDGDAVSQTMVMVDREGRTTQVDTTFTGDFWGISIDPSGTRAAVGLDLEGRSNVYVRTLSGGPWRRVTFYESGANRPAWFPSGDRVLYQRNGGPEPGIWASRVDGTGDPVLVVRDSVVTQEAVVSPDGAWIAYRTGPAGPTLRDIWIASLDSATAEARRPLAATNFDEHSPTFSPDGRWIAYVSDETGRNEVFVRPFPDTDAGKWQVSDNGGREPVWAREGGELFYRTDAGEMIAARYEEGPGFSVVTRTVLFANSVLDSDPVHQSYDVMPDGQSFVMALSDEDHGDLILVRNWLVELERRLAGGN